MVGWLNVERNAHNIATDLLSNQFSNLQAVRPATGSPYNLLTKKSASLIDPLFFVLR
jgi:hypothetical protein